MEPLVTFAMQCAFALALSVLGSAAPIAPEPTVSPVVAAVASSQDVSPAATVPLVWSGRVSDGAGGFKDEPLSKTHARDLLQKLAALRVQIDVERKFDATAQPLEDLWIRATRPGYPERKDVLVEILLVRAGVVSKTGSAAQAAEDLGRVLLSGTRAGSFELVAASPADRKLAEDVAADPRIVALRESLSRSSANGDPGGDKIFAIVSQALSRGDMSLSSSLGDRAVPPLVTAVESSLEDFPQFSNDALHHLHVVNSARAAELVARNWSKGGSIWKARVLRLLKSARVFVEGPVGPFEVALWRDAVSPSQPPTFQVPRWFDVLEILLSDPATRREALQLASGLPERNALTPGMQRILSAMCAEPSTPLVKEVMTLLTGARGRPCVQPILEAMLASPDAKAREFAVNMLHAFERSPGLLANVDHRDPYVRAGVATMLRGHYVTTPQYPFNSTTSFVAIVPNADERALLTKLATDADANVRAEAARTIATLTQPLESGVYERLARDPESKVRVAVLEAEALPSTQRASLALGLAGDTDATVLRSLDDQLCELARGSAAQSPIPIEWLPVLRARRANPVAELDAYGDGPRAIYGRMSMSPEGMSQLLEWAAAPGGDRPTDPIVDRLGALLTRNETMAIPVDGATWAAAFRRLTGRGEYAYATFARFLSREESRPTQEFLTVAEDATLLPFSRISALTVAAKGPGSRVVQLVMDVLRSPNWGDSVQSKTTRDLLARIVTDLDAESRGRLLDAVLADRKVPKMLALPILNTAAGRGLSQAQAEAILKAWLDDVDARLATDHALRTVARGPRAAQGEWLTLAAHRGHLCATAFELIGDLRDPSYTDLLRQALTGSFEMEGPSPDYRAAALNALTRYFDQRAADIILEVAGSTANAALREDCFKALETLRKYEAEKGRVQKDRVTRAAVETAVQELVTMLDDADPAFRVQALRGLATLGAVDQMPAIVRRLKDADERVRKAAEAALDALNAPPTPK